MPALPISLLIGLRFSRGRQRSGIVSLISVISTLGIALGVAVLIIGLSAMNGFERELKNRILAAVPHAEVEPLIKPFNDWRTVSAKLIQEPKIIAIAPFVEFTGLIEGGTQLRAIKIKGVDVELEAKLSILPDFVMHHGWQNFQAGKQQLILGKGIAGELGVKQGDWVTVMIPNNDGGSNGLKIGQPKRVRLQVSGILDMVGLLGYGFGMVPLTDAQQYLDLGDSVTAVAIKTSDVYDANQIAISAAQKIGGEYYVRSWMRTYGKEYRDIQMVRTIMYLAMVLVIGVACFNIVSTLVMAVKDKSADIAILRTLGAKDNLIRSIFVWYGLVAGLIGSLTGVVLGVVIALNLTSIIRFIEKMFDHHFLSGGVYFIDFLPSELYWSDVALVLFTAIVLSLLASWYPAQRASKINPAQVLSGQ